MVREEENKESIRVDESEIGLNLYGGMNRKWHAVSLGILIISISGPQWFKDCINCDWPIKKQSLVRNLQL